LEGWRRELGRVEMNREEVGDFTEELRDIVSGWFLPLC
jgi:hypothetical protein